MKWSLMILAAVVVAGGVYAIRTIQAEPGQDAARVAVEEPPMPEPQVEGRIVQARGGSGGTFLCEFDALVRVDSSGRVLERVAEFGAAALVPGLPVQVGEQVYPLDVEQHEWFTSNGWPVYRDASGDLNYGCAPESVVIPPSYPDPDNPWTPPTPPPGWEG